MLSTVKAAIASYSRSKFQVLNKIHLLLLGGYEFVAVLEYPAIHWISRLSYVCYVLQDCAQPALLE